MNIFDDVVVFKWHYSIILGFLSDSYKIMYDINDEKAYFIEDFVFNDEIPLSAYNFTVF